MRSTVGIPVVHVGEDVNQDYLTRASNLGSVRQRVQQTSLAWNAFCEGRDLKIIKCIVDAQITIWGTPIKAKK